MIALRSTRIPLVLALVAISWLAAWPSSTFAQAKGVTVTKVPPPNRDGANPGDNTSCPPGPDAATKATPDATLGDADKDGDGRKDFFMGEYDFVKGDKDLHVKCWCMNKPPLADGSYGDYFTKEIVVTEKNKPDVTAVPANDEAT